MTSNLITTHTEALLRTLATLGERLCAAR